MKKIGILTLNGNVNYGNRLQNYALKKVLENLSFKVETIWFADFKFRLKSFLKKLIFYKAKFRRQRKFSKFTDKFLDVKFYKNSQISDKYDYFVVGSDQVWNYNFSSYNKKMFLDFSPKEKNISYAASIGVDKISEEYREEFQQGLCNFKSISVREDKAKELVEELTNRHDIEVLVDPTMLLSAEEWEGLARKPKCLKNDKFILNYFLGELSQERKNEIEKIALENDCQVINILDTNSKFYECGPREFLYLEKNAFLVCTDSFHSSVFAFLFNRPFVVFDREDKEEKMGSRIDTLINKFKLQNRKYNGEITIDNIKHDYSNAYKILEDEKIKSFEFLKNNFDICKKD